jgi:hypothetical protein
LPESSHAEASSHCRLGAPGLFFAQISKNPSFLDFRIKAWRSKIHHEESSVLLDNLTPARFRWRSTDFPSRIAHHLLRPCRPGEISSFTSR